MRGRPVQVSDAEIRIALAEGWGFGAVALRYAAVGAGSYHWVGRDSAGERRFVTVDDLDVKAWLGGTRPRVLAGLRTAMDTAVALRAQAALPFVAAPLPALGGETVRPLGGRYAIATFPYLDGLAGQFGDAMTAPARAELADLLAALHQTEVKAPPRPIGLPGRDLLEAVLNEPDRPWPGRDPFAERARVLLAASAARLRDLLARFDELAGAVADSPLVITHGEPHPGNVMRVGAQMMLIDWDTVGMAPPERDLWFLIDGTDPADDAAGEARRYAEATGHWPAAAALAAYRLRWTLDDIAAYLTGLRSASLSAADAEHALAAIRDLIQS